MRLLFFSILMTLTFHNAVSQKIITPTTEFHTDASPLDLHKDRKQMVMADVLNVRAEPHTRSEILGKIREGSVINVTEYEEGNDFAKVMYADGTDVHIGYVAVDYLTPLFLQHGAFKAYAKVNVSKRNDTYYQDLTLYEVSPSGRKEIFKAEGEMDRKVRLSLASAPQNHQIERIITIQRTDYECCLCGSSYTQIIQGVQADLIIQDYRIEEEMDELYKLHLANKWDQEEYDIALTTGSYADYRSNRLDSVRILEKYRLNRSEPLAVDLHSNSEELD